MLLYRDSFLPIASSCFFILLSIVSAENVAQYELSSSSCHTACEQLAPIFGTNLHFPGNGNFTVWDAKQQEVQSACRVQPSTSDDVAKIMQIVVGNWCRFAVKGGGHARNPDDSVSVGGVTIDIVKMRSVDVSLDRATVHLGSGHVLHSVYTGLERFNLSTTVGRVADVGLGGYALGGGISNLSPKYGMAVDNVFEYEVVLANSSIAIVNEKSHPDLYFALRGGMNNFGIVTRFTMRTVPQGQIYAGSRIFSLDQREAVVREAYKLTTEWKNDTDMAFSYGFSLNPKSDQFTLSMSEAYVKPVSDPQPFKVLNRLPYISSTLRIDWQSNFSYEVASGRPPGGRNLYSTFSYYPAESLDLEIQDILMQELQPVKFLPGFSPNVIFQPLYEAAIRAARDRGGSSLGIHEAEGPLTMVLLTTQWTDAQDDAALYAFVDRFTARAKAATVRAGKDHRWMYINYASQNQDPFAGYGEHNLQRLKRIQKTVDTRGVFTSTGLCRGYFKLN